MPRLRSLGALVLGALALAGCGASAATDPRGKATAANGYASVSEPQYSLRVPTEFTHKLIHGSGGRVINAWTDPVDAFIVEAIYDPHPGSLSAAVRQSVTGVRKGYTVTKLSIRPHAVPGATTARLITDSGHEPKRLTPEAGADLLARTPSGASLELLVISRGTDNPDPMAIIRSVRVHP